MARLVAGMKEVECKLVIFDKNGTLVDQQGVLLELAKARKNAMIRNSNAKIAEHWEKAVGVDLKKKR